jgi:hypothetical protein
MHTRTTQSMDSPSLVNRWPRISGPIVFGLLLASMFFAILALARANVLTFPLPNEDDASFFFPAWSLAVHGTLRVPLLNAPDGIFWVPHGFYLWLSLFLRAFAPTVEVARTVCQLTTAAAAVLLVMAYARICGSRGYALLCGLLLVSPGVIFAANTVRMESLMLLLLATGLLLHSYQRRLAAAAVFVLAVVIHPALVLGAALYAVCIFEAQIVIPRVTVKGRILTLAIVFAVVSAIGLEAVYVLHHLPTFHQHMAYQVARKANRSPLRMLFTRRGLLLICQAAFTSAVIGYMYRLPHAWRIFVRELLPLFLLALGLSAYATLGREIPYNVYCYAVLPATFFCLAVRMLSLPLTAR